MQEEELVRVLPPFCADGSMLYSRLLFASRLVSKKTFVVERRRREAGRRRGGIHVHHDDHEQSPSFFVTFHASLSIMTDIIDNTSIHHATWVLVFFIRVSGGTQNHLAFWMSSGLLLFLPIRGFRLITRRKCRQSLSFHMISCCMARYGT